MGDNNLQQPSTSQEASTSMQPSTTEQAATTTQASTSGQVPTSAQTLTSPQASMGVQASRSLCSSFRTSTSRRARSSQQCRSHPYDKHNVRRSRRLYGIVMQKVERRIQGSHKGYSENIIIHPSIPEEVSSQSIMLNEENNVSVRINREGNRIYLQLTQHCMQVSSDGSSVTSIAETMTKSTQASTSSEEVAEHHVEDQQAQQFHAEEEQHDTQQHQAEDPKHTQN